MNRIYIYQIEYIFFVTSQWLCKIAVVPKSYKKEKKKQQKYRFIVRHWDNLVLEGL